MMRTGIESGLKKTMKHGEEGNGSSEKPLQQL